MNSAFHKHHRKLRSQGGTGEWGNMIEIPSEVHELIHAHPEVAYEHGLLVKSYDDPHQIRPKVREFLAAVGYEGELRVKPKRKRTQGEERRKRRTISVKVPADRENGGEVWDEVLELTKQKHIANGLYSEGDAIPNYEAIIAGLYHYAVLSDA